MNAESIRELLHRQPFDVCMTNGDVHHIPYPELALLADSRLVLHYPETDRMVILSLLHAAVIDTQQST